MTHEHLNHLSLDLLGRPYDELNDVQKRVIDLILAEQPSDPRLLLDEEGTFWTRLADRVAAVGGSWGFIGGFGLALLLWLGWNVATRGQGLAFDHLNGAVRAKTRRLPCDQMEVGTVVFLDMNQQRIDLGHD